MSLNDCLCLQHFEYTRDLKTAEKFTLPLLSGLLDYWECYVTKVPDAAFPDGYRFDDVSDRYAEPPPAGTCTSTY